jgi:hypothetical protein
VGFVLQKLLTLVKDLHCLHCQPIGKAIYWCFNLDADSHLLDVPQNVVSGFLVLGSGRGDTSEEDAGGDDLGGDAGTNVADGSADEMEDDLGGADTTTVSTTIAVSSTGIAVSSGEARPLSGSIVCG